MGFARLIKAASLIYFVPTTDEQGRAVHFFVNVDPAKQRAFVQAMRSDALVDYSAYGEVIARGFGHTPSDEVDAMLLRDYQYDYKKAL